MRLQSLPGRSSLDNAAFHPATSKTIAWSQQQVRGTLCRTLGQTSLTRAVCPALVIYEHACTLSQEADVIWSRKKTGATLLFLLNRFATAGFAIVMILLLPNWGTLLA